MINTATIENWKKEDALAYLFLAVADSDFKVDATELMEITRFLHSYTNSDKKSYEILTNIRSILETHNFETREEIVIFIKNKFLHHEEESQEIVDAIEEIIVADMVVDKTEMRFYHYIKKILLGEEDIV